MCRVFLADGKIMYTVMVHNWKCDILQCQILQSAAYLYLNSVHFIIYTHTHIYVSVCVCVCVCVCYFVRFVFARIY